mgnify:CR=1 FL=1
MEKSTIIGILILLFIIIGGLFYTRTLQVGNPTGNVVAPIYDTNNNRNKVDNKAIPQENKFDINKVRVTMDGSNYVELYRNSGGKNKHTNVVTVTNNNEQPIWVEVYCDTELNHLFEDTESMVAQCSPYKRDSFTKTVRANSRETYDIRMMAHSHSNMIGKHNAIIRVNLKKIIAEDGNVERSDNLAAFPITIKINN